MIVTGPTTVKLAWTGSGDLRFNVFRGSTKLGGNTSSDNPKTIVLSLTAGTGYEAAVWAASGAGAFTLSVIEDIDGEPPPPDPGAVVPVPSAVETAPVAHSGDAADDPAIWANPLDAARSLVIGNDKLGALESYDLGGARVQRITTGTGAWGNVDVRGDYVAAANRGIRVYSVNPNTPDDDICHGGNGCHNHQR